METVTSKLISAKYREVQKHICERIAEADGSGTFIEDPWQREGGGGGLSRVLTDGFVLEKAGVNFSEVSGELSPPMKRSLKIEGADRFFATGVSIVMHPNNPHVPIIHMNIRYFELNDGSWWFGGGIDLTPHYVNTAQAAYFHRQLKVVCDKYHPQWYSEMKKKADDYFFIPHRNETRGIGGIFYDHLRESEEISKEQIFQFSLDLGYIFPEIYTALIDQNRGRKATAAERDWQLLRRGRYVEFNLVYDRGTRFGLLSNGRTESILMSLPRDARWLYDFQPQPGSAEAKTLHFLRKDIDWINAS